MKVNLMSEILARPGLRNEHLRKPQNKKNVPRKAAWDLARKIYKLKAGDNATFYSPVETKVAVFENRKHRRSYVCC